MSDEPVTLTELHWHEYLERAHIAEKVLNEILCEHLVCSEDADVQDAVDYILDLVADLYQMVGEKVSET